MRVKRIVKRIVYYKELSKIINENINLMRFCNRKNNDAVELYFNASNKLIDNYFDNGHISCDAYLYFRRRVFNGYWL